MSEAVWGAFALDRPMKQSEFKYKDAAEAMAAAKKLVAEGKHEKLWVYGTSRVGFVEKRVRRRRKTKAPDPLPDGPDVA